MFPLHKAPRGLLELFRLRTLGQQPAQFAEHVSPVVDTTDFYGVDLVVTNAQQTSGAAFTQALEFTLTDGPRRFLGLGAQVEIGATGGTYLTMRLGVRDRVGGAFAPMFYSTVGTVDPGVTYGVGGFLSGGLVLNAGSVITAVFESDAPNADHDFSVRTLFQDLRAQ